MQNWEQSPHCGILFRARRLQETCLEKRQKNLKCASHARISCEKPMWMRIWLFFPIFLSQTEKMAPQNFLAKNGSCAVNHFFQCFVHNPDILTHLLNLFI